MADPPKPAAPAIDARVEVQLKEYRSRIDRLDEDLVRLLNARAACANEIGRLKDQVGMETYQPNRELEVLEHVRTVNAGPLDGPRESRACSNGSSTSRDGSNGSLTTETRDRGTGRSRVPPELRRDSMVVVMEERAPEDRIQHVIATLVEKGFDVHRSTGAMRTVLGAVGGNREFDTRLLEVMEGVHEVVRITEPYKLASRTFRPEATVVSMGDFRIGGDEVIVMAGPCSAETEDQVEAAAAAVAKAGAKVFRGGAFKPRSSPYSFQGLGEDGLRMMRAACDRHNLKLVSEVMDVSQIELVDRYADMLQVGARNMQNFTLLRELGRSRTPVLLKRGISATIEEWLLSAEYVLAGGNGDVVLCERGIRTFESYTRKHARHLGRAGHPQAEPPADRRRPRATARDCATRWPRWRAPPWPREPTA